MNYYAARPVIDGSGFHYTVRNDDHIWPVGYCEDHPPHATEEEAQECFRSYLLDGQCDVDYEDWTGCKICDAPTKKGLTTRPPLGWEYPLCDEHRTPEQLEMLVPPIGRITASY